MICSFSLCWPTIYGSQPFNLEYDTERIPSFILVGHNAPSLLELVNLPVTDWHSLGLQLGVTYHRLKTIQANNAQYPDSLERCVADMFQTWLDNDLEPSYGKIGKALCAAGMPELAQQFCRRQGKMYWCDILSVCIRF